MTIPAENLSFTDAAEKVLREEARGRPMHYADIVQIAIEKEWLDTSGQTPERTLNAQIGTENRRREARGEDPRFTAHGSGYYSLSAPSKGIERDLDKYNEQTRSRLHDALYEIDPEDFEHLIAKLLAEVGYEDIEITSYTADRGIDIRALLTVGGVARVKTAVQVKRHKKNIGSPIVRELRGSLGVHQRGLIITTADFTRGAYEEAAKPDRTPISLVGGDRLIELLVEHDIGVSKKSIALLELDREALEGEPVLPELETDEVAEGAAPKPIDTRQARRRASDRRVASIWPLPGGADKYAETLFRLLDLIVREQPTQEDVAAWLISEFSNVTSGRTTRGYLQVLRGMNLIRYEAEDIVLTSTGAGLAASQSLEDLHQVLEESILGVVEIQEFLRIGPATREEIHDHLVELLDLSWKTSAQTDWRLNWMECVDAIEKSDDLFLLHLSS